MEKDIKTNSDNSKELPQKPAIKRRTLLKAIVGIPVLGVFAFELFRK
jgi:hypothetical protein